MDLGWSDQTIYNWRHQDLIDRGLEPGATSTQQTALRAAGCRIKELKTELAVTKRAIELLKGNVVLHGRDGFCIAVITGIDLRLWPSGPPRCSLGTGEAVRCACINRRRVLFEPQNVGSQV